MAFPVVESSNSGASTANLTVHTVNLPSSIASGRLLLLFVASDSASTIAVTTPASGWSLLGDALDGGSSVRFSVFYRITNGAEASTIQLTVSSNQGIAYSVYQISGQNGDLAISSSAEGTSTSPNAASLNPSGWDVEDTLWFVAYGWDGNVAHSAYPADYSANQITARWADANGVGVASASRELASASDDPAAGAIASSDGLVAFTVAVRPVAADVTAPTISSATIDAAGTQLTIVFSEAVTGDGTGFTIDNGSPLTATYVSGIGTDTWVFSLSGTVLDADTPVLDYDAGTGDMADLAANALATVADGAVTNGSTQVADVTAPTLSTAVLSGSTSLVLTFSEAVTLTDQTGMTVSASGGAVTISSIAGDGTDTLTATLSRSVASTESLSFSYDSGTGNVEDLAGNALATISNRLVTNNVSSGGGIASYGIKTGGQL